jgi:hypothetical protein
MSSSGGAVMTGIIKKAVTVGLLVFLLGGMVGTARGAYGQVYSATPSGAILRERLNFNDVEGHWAQGAIIRQVALGILDDREANRFSPEASATRLEVLQALLRLLGLEAQGPLRVPAADPTAAYLLAAQQAGVITPGEAAELNWQDGARRQEVAAWLVRALGVSPVATPQLVRSFLDWPQVAGQYLGEVEALLAMGHLKGVGPGLLAPTQIMKRGELAALLDSVGDEFLPSLGITAGRGQVIDSEEFSSYGQGWGERLYHIVTPEGTLLQFLTAPSQSQGAKGGSLVVSRGGRVGGREMLQVGDLIRYYLVRDEVLLVEVLTSPTHLLQGRIEDIDPERGWLDFSNLQGQRSRFFIEPGVEVSLNGYPARVEELFPGQEANLEVQDGNIVGVTAFLPEGQGGYLAPGARVRTGQVRNLKGDTLVILREGREESYHLDPGTVILRAGTRQQAGDLRPGDRVTLYFNDPEGDTPARVLVDEGRQRVRKLYRGTITLVSPLTREIVLARPEQFNMATWEPVSSSLRLELAPGVEIYTGGRKITPGELAAGFTGEEVYVAVQAGYGREQAIKIVVKAGFAREYYGKIRAVDSVAGEIELDRDYLQYGPGTIFLWEERLIDPTVLERGQEVLILAASSGTGPLQALVVSVEDVEEPKLDIYWGRLESIGLNYLELEYISSLEEHRWREWRRSATRDLRLNQDTLFWDNTRGGMNKPLTKGEFEQRRSREDYEGTSVLVLAQGEETVALGMWPRKTAAGERVTVGRIQSIDRQTGVITLERVKDWNNASREWRLYPGALDIDAGEAVTARGRRGISWSELQPGDNLYLVREGMKGRVILVQ